MLLRTCIGVESKAVAQIVTEVPVALGLPLRMPLNLYVCVHFALGAVLKERTAPDAATEGFSLIELLRVVAIILIVAAA